MKDKEFNLLDEAWIRVMDKQCHVKEVSLTDALLHAHEYTSLAGELPTQDIVILRLMLAVLHTVFSRVDENGEELEISSEDEAKELWKNLWEAGSLPEEPIREYLETWHERFWLFHPERPFGQVAGLTYGTKYEAPKLNGEISESGNKLRMFSAYSGTKKSKLSYSQAARWLLYLNAYDDTSAKPSKEGKEKAGGKLPSPGAGWLGKLGLVYLKGNNLFETLLLNFVLINENRIEDTASPVWEDDFPSVEERTEIPMPDNLAALYTLQSRRISLQRMDDSVTGYYLIGGDFFQKENTFAEPMTIWRAPKKGTEAYTPKRHDSEKQLWREFSTLYGDYGDEKDARKSGKAGVIVWYQNCVAEYLERSAMMRTVVVSVQYGDKDFFVKHCFSDSLMMHSRILTELGGGWRSEIQSEIEHCEKLAIRIGGFAKELYIASGGSDNDCDKAFAQAKGELFFRLDLPFRRWLASIDPQNMEGKHEKLTEWQNEAKSITLRYAEELAENASEIAIVGHKIGDKLYSVPNSLNRLKAGVSHIYHKV